MPTAKVRNLENKEVGDVELNDAIFGVELNESLIHAAVRNYLANRRQGTSATKTRGNVHGPQPRDWSYKMPKKMRRGALRSALSERLREGNLIIIEDFTIQNPRTKDFIGVMSSLGFNDDKKRTKTLIVDSLENANLVLASRNVQKTKITNGYGLNIYDIIYHEKVLISKSAVEELNHFLDPKRETKTETEAA